MTALGDMILKRRTGLRMSLEDVAKASGSTKAHVWEIEKGYSRNPTVKTLVGLAKALGVLPGRLANAAFEDVGK